MIIKPFYNRIYVVLDAVEEKTTSGGLVLPDFHREATRRATIKAIGDKLTKVRAGLFRRKATRVKVGDRIIIDYSEGTVVDFDFSKMTNDCHRIISEEAILCKIEGE